MEKERYYSEWSISRSIDINKSIYIFKIYQCEFANTGKVTQQTLISLICNKYYDYKLLIDLWASEKVNNNCMISSISIIIHVDDNDNKQLRG